MSACELSEGEPSNGMNSLRSVEDVFFGHGASARSSATQTSPFARNSSGSARDGSIRLADVPEVLKGLSEMPAFHGLHSTSDSGKAPSLPDPDHAAVVYDVDALRASFAAVKEAFPPHWKHCFAVKACPLAFVIQEALDAGLGVEAASFEELYLALVHGCPSDLAVFDSPAKTNEELEMALASGALVNANSLDELDRINGIILQEGTRVTASSARVGIRLNPLVGEGSIAELSVSVPSSKFGVPATPTNILAVVEAFRQSPWIVGLHAHVGSQGFSLAQLAKGIATLCGVADVVDGELGKGRVSLLDIGGGLPANYDTDDVKPTWAEYAAVLRGAAPSLFETTDRTVVTEFGRAVVLKTALTVSTIEYVRNNIVHQTSAEEASDVVSESDAGMGKVPTSPDYQTLVTHVGADLFLRTAYCPDKFSHRFSVYGSNGEPLSRPLVKTDVAGPLCFRGDYVGRELNLPRATEGDLVVVHDTGANTLSLFSRHCSRRSPAVYGYARDGEGGLYIKLIKKKETIRDIARFWGARSLLENRRAQ